MSPAQLAGLGLSRKAIRHRLATGRLHRLRDWPGVLVVGRPEPSRRGVLRAALMTCGEGAALSVFSGGEQLRFLTRQPTIHVSIPYPRDVEREGIVIHRVKDLEQYVQERHGLRVTNPVRTIIDIASTRQTDDELEEAIAEASRLRLVSPRGLRGALENYPRVAGVARVGRLLDKQTFTLSQTQLERWFVPVALEAGYPKPLSQEWVNGYRVDFYWPELGLVVETDGGEWHRDARQQRIDRRRDQAHTAAGLTQLRFTHWQVRYEPAYVLGILRQVLPYLRPG